MNDLTTLEQDAWRLSPDTFAVRASGGDWLPYRHVEYAATIIRHAIVRGGGRVIVSMPPRHGKSELCSHWLPTWFLELWPYKKVIITSYGDKLAKSFGRQVKREIEQNRCVTTKLTKDSTAAAEFETTKGGGLITAGIGGGITGRGGDLIIIDDPIKTLREAMSKTIREWHIEWFKTVLYTRCEPESTIILVTTRWHQKDLAGYLIKEHSDDWTEIKFPALAEKKDPLGRKEGEALCPERFDEKALKKARKSIGMRRFPGLYQQRPSSMEGTSWKRHYWKRWEKLPEKFTDTIQSWDTNIKEEGGSYVVGQVWGRCGADRYMLDQIRGKWGFNEMIKKFIALSEKWPNATRKLVENKATGPAIQNHLKTKITGIILVEPQGGKEVRATAAEPELEAGNCWLPSDEVMYPWVQGFIEEAADFPNAENDDQVDTASQALTYFRSRGMIAYGAKDRKKKKTATARGLMGS